MWRLFLRHSLRYFRRHRALTALNIAGIALGVTVFVSVQIVNHSALQSFRASVDVVAGRATLEVRGDGLRFDENIYPVVRAHRGIAAATPVLEQVAMLADFPGEYLQIVGIDVFSNRPFRTFEFRDGDNQAADGYQFIEDPSVIAISEGLASRLGLKQGDPIRIRTQQGEKAFKVGFLLKFGEDTPGADEHVSVMDIASLQQSFRLNGVISRIDCRLEEGTNLEAIISELQANVPANVLVQAPERRGRQIEKMIGAFQLNLTALSLISLLVGMFLIYNTVSAAVVRRRTEIGVLRTLGFTPGQVQVLFLSEAMVLGIAGTLAGIVFGVMLAGKLVGVVSQNITSLYILLSIRHLFVSPWMLAAACLLAVGAVMIAAWFPSREAAGVSPVEALTVGHLASKSKIQTGRWLAVAAGLLGIALLAAVVSLNGGAAWLSFACALFTLLGFAFLVPFVSGQVAIWLRPGKIEWKIAVIHFGQSLHRNSVTIAAMVTALAMLVGISVMIFSFRQTVETWLGQSVRADMFVAPASSLIVGHREVLRPEVEPAVRSVDGIAAFDTYREVRITFRDQPVKLASIRFDVSAIYNPLHFLRGDGKALLQSAMGRDMVMVTESFARKFKVRDGDVLALATPTGLKDFAVGGVFYDYTTDSGLILMDAFTYQKNWNDTSVNSLALYLKPGVRAEEVRDRIRPLVKSLGEYLLYSNQQLRTQVFRIFDQTFAVTYVLQTIGILISGLGVLLSLTILVTERRREIGILRAVGASRSQVRQIVLGEAALIGVVGSVFGVIAGLALASVLMYVINIAFFGWTIAWATPWLFLAALVPAVTVVSTLSAWYPAQQAAGLDIADAVKME